MFNILSRLRCRARSTSSATASSPDSKLNGVRFHNLATHPLVSALIVFDDPSRVENLRSALAQFKAQTWPYKEAVVINATSLEVPPEEDHCVRVLPIMAKYLGELKNLALYNALGEWCLPWLDDCRYAPEYIAWHMHRRSKAFPTVVANPLAEVLKEGIVHPVDWDTVVAASFFRFGPYIYDQDGSDVRFLNKYPEKNLSQAGGGLVTRFFEDYAAD